jgi:hypothetical protein
VAADQPVAGDEPAAGAEPAPAAGAPAGSDVPTTEIPAAAPAAPQGPRKINQPEAKPVDLLEAAGGSVLQRLRPLGALVGFVVIVALWRRLRQAKRAG